jgi:hypothetical protein
MKKLLFIISLLVVALSSCEKIVDNPDPVEYFTDITYKVTSTSVLTPTINYGDLKYSDPNKPNELVWDVVTVTSAKLPWTKTVNTCVGHPVRIGSIVSGGGTMTFEIYNNNVLVASKTFESNGFLWGGNLEYNIPQPK